MLRRLMRAMQFLSFHILHYHLVNDIAVCMLVKLQLNSRKSVINHRDEEGEEILAIGSTNTTRNQLMNLIGKVFNSATLKNTKKFLKSEILY